MISWAAELQQKSSGSVEKSMTYQGVGGADSVTWLIAAMPGAVVDGPEVR